MGSNPSSTYFGQDELDKSSPKFHWFCQESQWRARGGDSHFNNESNSGGTSWPFSSQIGSSSSRFGENPYPTYGLGFLPFTGIIGDRPEPRDPLYTSAADGPELYLISQQLSGLKNYYI